MVIHPDRKRPSFMCVYLFPFGTPLKASEGPWMRVWPLGILTLGLVFLSLKS